MEREKSKNKNNDISLRNNKVLQEQKLESELKRFKSHEVYLVNPKNDKKAQKFENSSKEQKKIYINISQADKMKPKQKTSFNNNSNMKHQYLNLLLKMYFQLCKMKKEGNK